MLPTRNGGLRLFQFKGIEVFLHWSWFLVAAYMISTRESEYPSRIWIAWEYIVLFSIVLLHEFGHAFACRSVGGKANQIILWPLGGVAYVAPPPRPGATLWSIAAGPLVNVGLIPVFGAAWIAGRALNWESTMPTLFEFLVNMNILNGVLLAFNLLPVYPLDGGQILRSLLWFPLGRGRSLMVAAWVGVVGVVVLLALGFFTQSPMQMVMMVFILLSCWRGLMEARALSKIAKLPRRGGFACPSCRTLPPMVPIWLCSSCHHRFDTFATGGICPNCGVQFPTTVCFECGESNPMQEWIAAGSVPPRL